VFTLLNYQFRCSRDIC